MHRNSICQLQLSGHIQRITAPAVIKVNFHAAANQVNFPDNPDISVIDTHSLFSGSGLFPFDIIIIAGLQYLVPFTEGKEGAFIFFFAFFRRIERLLKTVIDGIDTEITFALWCQHLNIFQR